MTARPDTIAQDNDRGFSAATAQTANPVICRRRLGAELRRLRQERGFRLDDAAARLDVGPSTLSRIETGLAPTRISYLNILLDLYEVHDSSQRALSLEATASYVRAYSAVTVPGLLQTADYAAAAYRASRPDLTSGQIAKLVAWHAGRQESLRRDGVRVHWSLTKPHWSGLWPRSRWSRVNCGTCSRWPALPL